MIFQKPRIIKMLAIFKQSEKVKINTNALLRTNDFQNENKLLLHLQSGKQRDCDCLRSADVNESPSTIVISCTEEFVG